MRGYPTDLNDAEWAVLRLLPAAWTGRPRSRDLRPIVSGILYVLRAGCAWRLTPNDFGPWVTIHYYFRKWRDDGTWERRNHELRRRERVRQGREPEASAAIIDSQSGECLSVPSTALVRMCSDRFQSVPFSLPLSWAMGIPSLSSPVASTDFRGSRCASRWQAADRKSFRYFPIPLAGEDHANQSGATLLSRRI